MNTNLFPNNIHPMVVVFGVLWTCFTFVWLAIFMNMTIFEQEALVTLIFVDEMSPEITFGNQGALVVTGEVINIIKVENVYNVV